MIADFFKWFFGLFNNKVAQTSVTPQRSLRNIILGGMVKRGSDAFGSGSFGASRDNGGRMHNGADYKARAGDFIMSPIGGTLTRTMQVYSDDSRYRGLEIVSTSGDIAVKMFYVNAVGNIPRTVVAGDHVGFAQNLSPKYAGITNHVHIEVRLNGKLENPELWFK